MCRVRTNRAQRGSGGVNRKDNQFFSSGDRREGAWRSRLWRPPQLEKVEPFFKIVVRQATRSACGRLTLCRLCFRAYSGGCHDQDRGENPRARGGCDGGLGIYRGDCENSADRALAVRACTEIINRDPNALVAFKRRGFAYLDQRQVDLAIADFTKAIVLDPRDARLYAIRGFAYENKRAYDLAIADYTRAIQIDPKYAVELFEPGLSSYVKEGRYRSRHCRLQLELSNSIPTMRTPMTAGERPTIEGVPMISLLLTLAEQSNNPKSALHYAGRGQAYLARGMHDPAIADFSRAIELEPKLALAYTDRGEAYLSQNADDLAIADFTRAIVIDPKYARPYGSRGFAYAGKEEYDRAITDYSRAIELNPKNALTFAYRGEAYLNMNYMDEAIADATKAYPAQSEAPDCLRHPRPRLPITA